MEDLSSNFLESGRRFPIEESNVFRVWKLEEDEIDKLRWIESEKMGFDIGRYRSEWIWLSQHREGWMRAMRESGRF